MVQDLDPEHRKAPDRLLRKVIFLGRKPGLAGALGRWAGKRVGWRLRYGSRVIIDAPDEYMQSHMLWFGAYEGGVIEVLLCLVHAGDVFLDVGGNMGQYAVTLGHEGARVHAFEPVPRLARRLRENIRLNGLTSTVTLVEAAVSRERGEAKLYVRGREDDGSHSLIAGVAATTMEEITVPTIRLDDYVAKNGLRKVKAIKIDVEGAEAFVLDGAQGLFASADAPIVLVETSDSMAAGIGETAGSVLERLFRHGYRAFRMDELVPCLREVTPENVPPTVGNYLCLPPGSPAMEIVEPLLNAFRLRGLLRDDEY